MKQLPEKTVEINGLLAYTVWQRWNPLIYPRAKELEALITAKLVSKRKHPDFPLWIYNYTAAAQFLPIQAWTPALCDARGLILDEHAEIIARPFTKFWNYEQVLDQVPSEEPFTVWEKLDGSLGIVCRYAGERIVATRGSFESEQAHWLKSYLTRSHPNFYPDGVTWLVEIVFPANRIVVDYGNTQDAFLLAILDDDGNDRWDLFDSSTRFRKARRFDGVRDFSVINNDPAYQGQEGFVVQWQSGLRAKIKSDEYRRLHRLITQCSTRTIWELLRTGQDTSELLDRVPADFKDWAKAQLQTMKTAHSDLVTASKKLMDLAPRCESRKDFAAWAIRQDHPNLMFSLLDGKDITDAAWKLVEPAWSTPFRKDTEG